MATVTNLTVDIMNLTTQMVEYANKMVTKDSAMEAMKNNISQLQGEIKTLKSKLEVLPTKKPEATVHKKGNWWSNPYCWIYEFGRHNGESCFRKSDGQKEKST